VIQNRHSESFKPFNIIKLAIFYFAAGISFLHICKYQQKCHHFVDVLLRELAYGLAQNNKKPAEPRHIRVLSFCCYLMHILLVPRAGIEPARLAARDFESRASTYSAISATHFRIMTWLR
jgi:hypothetical protein